MLTGFLHRLIKFCLFNENSIISVLCKELNMLILFHQSELMKTPKKGYVTFGFRGNQYFHVELYVLISNSAEFKARKEELQNSYSSTQNLHIIDLGERELSEIEKEYGLYKGREATEILRKLNIKI